MKEIQHVALIGLGAVGTVLAARLQQILPDGFTVIADEKRQQKLRRDGICLNGKRYDFAFTPLDTVQDMVLIATKATALDEAIRAVAPHVGPDTVILSLLNGIDSEQTIARRLERGHLLYSYFLGHPSMREGNHISHDGQFCIYFGEADNRQHTEAVSQVVRLFEQAGIPYEIPQDMISALWQKFIINIGCNQTTALLRHPYGHLQRNEAAMTLALRMMEEAADVARGLQIAEADRMDARAVEVIRSMNPGGKSSMQEDVEAGRPTEIDIFAGTLCRIAGELGCAVPWNRAALQILSAL